MADWLLSVAKTLLKLTKENPELAKEIYYSIKKIEKTPAQTGTWAMGMTYTYTDSKNRFRIHYNFQPKGKEIEITVLHILK